VLTICSNNADLLSAITSGTGTMAEPIELHNQNHKWALHVPDDHLDQLLKALDKFDTITKNAAAIKNSADSIVKEDNSIRASIGSSLGSAQAAISRGLEPGVRPRATTHAELVA
jgi:hypothetical protein